MRKQTFLNQVSFQFERTALSCIKIAQIVLLPLLSVHACTSDTKFECDKLGRF